LYRREAKKLKPPAPVYARVKAPPGIGAVWRSSGAGERARFEPSIPAKWPDMLLNAGRRILSSRHGEASVRSDIFPLVDGGLIGGRLWSEVEQRRALLRNLFGLPPT
jgi:hypothetical protein